MNGQALIFAILGGNTEKVQSLLAAGADPNEVTTSPWTRMTPLAALAASPTAGPEILSLLLTAGMRLFRNEEEANAWAALSNEEMLKRIRMSAIEPDGIGSMVSGFFKAIRWNRVDEVQRYLVLGLDPNLVDPDGYPALHLAESPEMIRLLIKAGANLEGRSAHGQTALGHAAGEANLEAVQTLVQLGADPNATHDYGYSVLMSAAGALDQKAALVRLLLDHGADAHHVSEFGHNALHAFVSSFDHGENEEDRDEIVRMLVEAGTSTEDRTNFGFTPLHFALLDDRDEDALKLLRHGADPRARVLPQDPEGEDRLATPLMMAVPHPRVVTALLAAGADPHATDAQGRTALDHAKAKAPTEPLLQSIALLEDIGSQ